MSLYERDFYLWTCRQAFLLKEKRFKEIDLENILNEIANLAIEQVELLRNILTVLLENMLIKIYKNEEGESPSATELTIFRCRMQIELILKDSPSLSKELNELHGISYFHARELAIIETDSLYINEHLFPKKCPWTLKEILGK